MCFANGRNLHHLGNAAHIGQRGAHVIDIVVFHQLVEIPAAAPFLARRNRHFHHGPEFRQISDKRLRAYGIFNEIRRQAFDQIAAAHGVGKIEALVEVDAEIAVLAHAVTHLHALIVKLIELLVCVVGRIRRRVGSTHAKGPVPGRNGRGGAILQAHAGLDRSHHAASVIALTVFARCAAEDFMHGNLEHLASYIPQRQIESAQRILLLTPRRIEKGARHILPEPLDILRILPDQPPRALVERIGKAAFADPRNARVGLDRDHHVRLIEQRVWPWRRVCAHPRDLHFGQFGLQQGQMRQCCGGCGRQRLEECPSVHCDLRADKYIPDAARQINS